MSVSVDILTLNKAIFTTVVDSILVMFVTVRTTNVNADFLSKPPMPSDLRGATDVINKFD